MTIDSNTVDTTQERLPLNLTELTDNLKVRAKLELHECEKATAQALKSLRHLMDQESDLNYPDSDAFLLQFLRARKFDVKKAAAVCRNYFVTKRKYNELFDNFNFATLQKTMDSKCVGFLPYRDTDGSAILVIRAGVWNPIELSMGEMMCTLTSGLNQVITSPATQIAGFKVIVDFKDFSIKHLTHVSTSYLWLFADALQNCFPGRFRAVHIVNEGHLFSYIWAVLKQLLSKKLKERFQFHGKNVQKIHKYISPSVLPSEYGGELGHFDNSVWSKTMKLSEDYLVSLYSYGYKKKTKS